MLPRLLNRPNQQSKQSAERYKADYLTTPYWQWKRHQLVKQNPLCWVCKTRNLKHLLPHHVSYANLYHERLYKDIYILCYTCHKGVHFWILGLLRVPLTRSALMISMRLRRLIFCMQKGQLIQATWQLIMLLVTALRSVV